MQWLTKFSSRSWSEWVLQLLILQIRNLFIVHTTHGIFTVKKKSLDVTLVEKMESLLS